MPGTPRYRGMRRTANRAALLGAAEELFGARAISSVSVDEIVARAGVAKGTFYNHFADKEDLAAHLAVLIRRSVRDSIAKTKTISSDPAMHLAIAVASFLKLAREQPNRALILITLQDEGVDAGAEINAPLRATLETGQSLGRFSFVDIDTALISVLGIVAAAIRVLIRMSASDQPPPVAGFVAHTLATACLTNPEDAQAIARRAVELVA